LRCGGLQAAPTQGAEELGPKVGGLAVADGHAEYLPLALDGAAGRDHDGLGGDPGTGPDGHVGGVEPQVRVPGLREVPAEELGHVLVDLGAHPGDLRLRDPGLAAERFDELVDPPGRHPRHPRLGDDRPQGLVDAAARLE
jgi:hypothetical protein